MKSILKFFIPNNQLYCERHKNHVSKICCHPKCSKDRINLICDHIQCSQAHRGHTDISYQVYKELIGFIENEIQFKKQIKASLASFKHEVFSNLNSIFQNVQNNVSEYLEKRCSSKYLVQIQKKLKTEDKLKEDMKFQFYSQFLQNFPKIQTINTRKFISEDMIKKIKLSQKRALKQLSFEFLGLNSSIFPDQSIRQIRECSKQEKLKKILPFKCQIKLKFRGSENNFLSSKLYETDIRGPIILLVESHKNRIFGGFSPVMFPKAEQYIEDNRKESFLFSLDDKCLLHIKDQFKQYSIRGGSNFWFGRGDLAISDQCQKGNISWAEIGRAYKAPTQAYGNESAWLAGAWYFRVLDYEIFEVDIQYK